MAMNQTLLNEYWQLLNLTEDYFCQGYKRQHAPAPKLSATAAIRPAAATELPSGVDLTQTIRSCTKCELHLSRRQAVTGSGAVDCQVLVVGDYPSAADDREGLPFCGQEGAYLDKWLEAIRINRRDNAFLCYTVACHPTGAQSVTTGQIRTCFPHLEARIRQLAPAAILCTGLSPGQLLTGHTDADLPELRGRLHSYGKIPLVVTYHPRTVLEDNSLRAAVWSDLKLLRSRLV